LLGGALQVVVHARDDGAALAAERVEHFDGAVALHERRLQLVVRCLSPGLVLEPHAVQHARQSFLLRLVLGGEHFDLLAYGHDRLQLRAEYLTAERIGAADGAARRGGRPRRQDPYLRGAPLVRSARGRAATGVAPLRLLLLLQELLLLH
jgi:hypothetical protein